jgi:hypothetical protein
MDEYCTWKASVQSSLQTQDDTKYSLLVQTIASSVSLQQRAEAMKAIITFSSEYRTAPLQGEQVSGILSLSLSLSPLSLSLIFSFLSS